MNLSILLAWITAGLTMIIAIIALWRDPRSFVHRVFAAGMLLFACDAGLTVFLYQSATTEQFLFRQWLQLLVASFLPAVWLLFSVSFARANYFEQIARWKWILLLTLVLPVALVTLFRSALFSGPPMQADSSTIFIGIGWSGYAWHLLWVILSVMILMNLERTFRHATGHMRWQTKFMFLGIGGIFGAHLFTDSQAVLFKGVNMGLDIVDLGALLIADIFMLRSLFRGKPLNVSVHLSHQFLYGSFTVLIVGIFFISVGVVAWFSLYFDWIRNIHVAIFLMLVAIMAAAAFLLSDRLRMMRKRFISRHFQRPQYDYQKIWEGFTERTASVTQTHDLCNVIVRMVSETLATLSVSIWLVDEKQESLSFGGSTVFTEADIEKLKFSGHGGTDLIHAMIDQTMPVDLEGRSDDWVEDLKRTYGFEDTKESRLRYCVPLKAAGHLIGIMTLSEKVFYESLTFEESELLKTMADQAAAGLLNLRLSEQLRQTKELEAFQTMSAFFMHDLKNLASKLSLVTQNLPVHMDNPEFREDAFRTIGQSVTKINAMSSRLSLLSRKLELAFAQADLNDLVEMTISEIKGSFRVPIIRNLEKLPPVSVDRDQVHKVIDNLLINANDALGHDGQIIVSTVYKDNWAEIAISDNGCGMSREFVEKNLFRPFQTTKKHGMGIGLYHCKTIVEAHGGRIEVESEEGKGTTFRVLLPVEKEH
ncbi:MAG: PEP-CTERM system histidine kinase PrsK [Deltaproteobacteria bacterium HGW-Deltaproteobacteria-12]|nr:MAG: PEP-CTERM system histidine kinase PrsK [Deltaproteobacteria bacterium HGW-Deltaproteobacteria-12]